MRSLHVYIDRRQIGILLENDDLWRFEYDAQWLSASDGFDIAPGIPRAQRTVADGATNRPVQWFFDNLLPEELLRQAISREAGIKGDDAFSLLEYLGAESAGSLTMLPPGQPLPEVIAVRQLSNETLSQRIRHVASHTLTAGAPKRMSLAGAQHKLLVFYEDGRLFEPVGATPSAHILKPNHPDLISYPASVINEYVTMGIAGAAGLAVPGVHIRYVPEPVYIVDRFDRRIKTSTVREDGLPRPDIERRHIIDACQLLTRSRTFKHSGATLDALREIIEKTTNRLHTRLQLFRWLVFNIIVGNDDSHLKNLSFHIGPDGIQLAPHYDLLSTASYYTKTFANERAAWPNVNMAIPLPGASMFSEVNPQTVLNAGILLGLDSRTVQRIVSQVIARIPDALLREKKAMAERHPMLEGDARMYIASEFRLVAVMEKIVVREMRERLGS